MLMSSTGIHVVNISRYGDCVDYIIFIYVKLLIAQYLAGYLYSYCAGPFVQIANVWNILLSP